MTSENLDPRIEAMKTRRMTCQEVAKLFGVHRPAIYRWMQREDGPFPQPKKRSPRRVFWYEYDVRKWAEQQGITLSDCV